MSGYAHTVPHGTEHESVTNDPKCHTPSDLRCKLPLGDPLSMLEEQVQGQWFREQIR